MKIRRFPPKRVEKRLQKAIELAIIYSKHTIIRLISKGKGVVDSSKMRNEKIKVRWASGELTAEDFY